MIIIQITLALISWGVLHYGILCFWREDFEGSLGDVPLAFITALIVWMDYGLITGRIQIVV